MTHANDVIRESDTCPTLQARMGIGGNQVPIVLSHPQGAAARAYTDGKAGTLTAAPSSEPVVLDVIGEKNGNANESDARKVLCFLREKVGEKAFAVWRSRVLDSLQSSEVLRSAMHGEGVRSKGKERRPRLDDRALPRAEDLPAGAVRTLWKNGPDRRTPQGRELAKQLANEFGSVVPRMPHQSSPSTGTLSVRRLTPVECERLMGMPDDWTRISWKGKPPEECPDAPRYKAIGNSWAVPVIAWIGERILKEMQK